MIRISIEHRASFGRRFFFTITLLAATVLAACSADDGSPSSCSYAVNQDLDAGRFDSALERLGSPACEAAMTEEQREMNRAAAHIGKAGFDVADIFIAVIAAGGDDDKREADLRLLEALTGIGARRGALRELTRADLAYGRMMRAFVDGLDEACRDENVLLLSRLQNDACFHSGLLGYARLARGFDLLLGDQLGAFLGLEALDCETDRDFSGTPDEAEISACALRARSDLDADGGVCREPRIRDGQHRGGVRWDRIAGVDSVAFFEDGVHFTSTVPIRVTMEAGGACEGPRESVRLLQMRPNASAQLLVTDGYCFAEIQNACSTSDPDLGCWPCPIPRVETAGAITVTETLLDAVNVEVERALAALTPEDAESVDDDLEEMRQAFCARAEGSDAECEESDGDTHVNLDALREYLRQ